jgi:formylglycine-generating enzyme required for sulfatase activity
MMGSEYGNSDEAPAHEVTLTNDFIVSKYEITQRIFKQVLKTNPSTFIGEDLPVHNVSRVQALEFCNKLSELNGLDVYYDLSDMNNVQIIDTSNGWRLPTEAEWEYFCRAGSAGEYPIDDIENIGDYAFYNLNSGMQPHSVGSKQANAFGLYDVIGNVYEWCWDYSGMYSDTKQTNPTGPATGTEYVVRGGSFNDGIFYLRSSNRKVSNDAAIGLRIVRAAL